MFEKRSWRELCGFFMLLLPCICFAEIEVQGHRGARGFRPENTLPAFDYALEIGVDTLELDIAVTKDDVPVISHEPKIQPERCLGPNGQKLSDPIPIRSLTWKEVQTYDCGSLPNPRFPEQKLVPATPIPRLADLFAHVKKSKWPAAKNVKFNIETKIYPGRPELTPEPVPFARLIIDLIQKNKLVPRCTLQSFDDRTLKAAKEIDPSLGTVMLTSDNHVDYWAVAKASGASVISPDYQWILKGDVQLLHIHGIKVIPWTVNDVADWDRLIEYGVDGIISDYPDRLINYLKSRGLRK